jgi:hypothetical protein
MEMDLTGHKEPAASFYVFILSQLERYAMEA